MSYQKTIPRRWKRRLSLIAALILPAYIGMGLILSAWWWDRQIPMEENIRDYKATGSSVPDTIPDTISIVSWNLMQAVSGTRTGGGDETSMPSRPSRADYDQCWNGIKNTIDSLMREDNFVLLQNISLGSKRTFYENQGENLNWVPGRNELKHTCYTHENEWCPLPLFSLRGRVASGMAIFLPENTAGSGSQSNCPRRAHGGPSWPARLWRDSPYYYQLTIQHHFRLECISVDLPPEDDSASIQEMLEDIQIIATREYEAGDHVILGGDWGMMPPFFRQEMFSTGGAAPEGIVQMPADWLPVDWTIAYDPMNPTMRSLNGSFNDHTPRTTTDFFICSPNVRVMEVQTVDMGFRFSNHQPVKMKVILQ